MHSGNSLLTKPHLSVKRHEMQFCYSKTLCHLPKNVSTGEASVMFEIEMRQESHSSSAIQTEWREIHYLFHKWDRRQDCLMDLHTSHWHSACLNGEWKHNDSIIVIHTYLLSNGINIWGEAAAVIHRKNSFTKSKKFSSKCRMKGTSYFKIRITNKH